MRLKNKTAIISGGALGFKEGGPSIGSEIAFKFAQEGAHIIVVDINEETGQLTADKIKDSGGKSIFIKADISKSDDIKNVIEQTEEIFGQLNCLVNCVATYDGNIFNNIVDTPEEDWLHIFNVNFHGYYRFAKFAIPLILKSGGGTIINISSGAAFKVTPKFAVYPCTKAAINALTRTIAIDFAPQIRCNAICPGFVQIANSTRDRNPKELQSWYTSIAEKYPLKRVCNVKEIANVALFLASDDSSYINGEAIMVDGGYYIADTHTF